MCRVTQASVRWKKSFSWRTFSSRHGGKGLKLGLKLVAVRVQTASDPSWELPVPEYFNFANDVIDRWARIQPGAPGLWHVDATTGTEQKFTFRQLSALSARAANFLRSAGVRRGDRVLVMLPRVPQWWIAMLGLIRLGAVPVPATLLLTARDVAYRLQAARVHAVITSVAGIAKVDGFDGVRFVVGQAPSGWIDFDAGLRAASVDFRNEATRSDDPGIIYFTSATTGDPKMVLHTQASYGLGHRLTGKLWLDCRPGDVHWNISDLGWGKAAWSSFYGPWQMGACVFALDVHGKFDPVQTLDGLARFPITTWCAPPTALRLIVRQNLSRWNFPDLRHCVTAGEPLNPEVLKLWKDATGLTLHEAYGQTETVVLAGNFPCLGHAVRSGSMGRATPGFDVGLLDEELQPVADRAGRRNCRAREAPPSPRPVPGILAEPEGNGGAFPRRLVSDRRPRRARRRRLFLFCGPQG